MNPGEHDDPSDEPGCPTICGDLPPRAEPHTDAWHGSPPMPRDAWRQVEFFPADRSAAVKAQLQACAVFESTHRTEDGWTQPYRRRLEAFEHHHAPELQAVAAALDAKIGEAPLLFTRDGPLGVVDGGFSLRLADSVVLYGTASGSKLTTFAAHVQPGGDWRMVASAFGRLRHDFGMVLVDWAGQTVFEDVGREGGLVEWSPAPPPSLPFFAYHPRPVRSGVVVASAIVCACCGEARDHAYVGPTFCEGADAHLCPWCISDGRAATRFDASFVDADPLARAGVDGEAIEQVTRRTPGYFSWQQDRWLAHCGDACEYLSDASALDVALASPSTREHWQAFHAQDEAAWQSATQGYEPGDGPAFYKFRCRHCRTVLFGWDVL